MKLSQLIYTMDKDDDIIVNTSKNVPIDKNFIAARSEEYIKTTPSIRRTFPF